VAEPDRTDQQGELRPGRIRPLPPGVIAGAGVLILIPIVALMWVGSYSKATPKLWGFPFFYWYQLLWVFIASGCTYLAYLLVHNARRGGDR
jgi:hypothetical protein